MTAVLCPKPWAFCGLGRIDVTVTETGWAVGDTWTVTASGPFCFNGTNPQFFTCFLGFSGTQVFVFDAIGGTGTITFSVTSTSGASAGPTPGMFVANPDCSFNASCRVDALDLSMFGQRYGGANPACDYNCDGLVTALDLSVLGQHYGH